MGLMVDPHLMKAGKIEIENRQKPWIFWQIQAPKQFRNNFLIF
jgi:hypothetical protein